MVMLYNCFAKNNHTDDHHAANNVNRKTVAYAMPTSEEIGKSRGGNSTKIHLAVDSHGYPVNFELFGGHRNNIVYAENWSQTAQPVTLQSQIKDTIARNLGLIYRM